MDEYFADKLTEIQDTGGLHCIFGYGYDLKCDSQSARSFNSD